MTQAAAAGLVQVHREAAVVATTPHAVVLGSLLTQPSARELQVGFSEVSTLRVEHRASKARKSTQAHGSFKYFNWCYSKYVRDLQKKSVPVDLPFHCLVETRFCMMFDQQNDR